jgi:nitrous oxide reductase accessory protein NosL
MKKHIIYIAAAILILGCGDKSEKESDSSRAVAVSAITSDMGCENCGMNLKKFISTGHAIKMKDNSSHFFCSINCSTVAWDSLGAGADSVFAVDFNSTVFVYAPEAHYVIGSSLRGTMTSVSKFTFGSLDDAESFRQTFDGKEIVDYQTAFDLSKVEIMKRRQ